MNNFLTKVNFKNLGFLVLFLVVALVITMGVLIGAAGMVASNVFLTLAGIGIFALAGFIAVRLAAEHGSREDI